MTKFFTIVLGFFCGSTTFAQGYFQQKANFEIKARLDDQKHLLTSDITMNYTHQGADTLKEIWFHLWANGHQSQSNTAMARQFTDKGKLDWYFRGDDALGGYTELSFFQNGEKLAIEYDGQHQDICKVTLAQQLLPLATITIKMTAKLKIPYAISRLGHVNQDYSMTQWFPKPAVYDQQGWHTFPYLDQGEFFSEFGDYEVDLTLPENYVVAATGVLQSEKELFFLKNKASETKKALAENLSPANIPIKSADRFKTIHYKASQVHDFAWFASKEFALLEEKASLRNGDKVDIYAYFPLKNRFLWQHAQGFAKRAIEYFSSEIGDYPYPQATVAVVRVVVMWALQCRGFDFNS